MPIPRDLVDKARAVKSEHKALGVVCFGYFRYRNARFGCAEVHQAIQCLGRAGMTRAREVAHEEGFEVVHTLTDCTFIQKAGVTRADAMRFARRVTKEVGVPMDVEGVYKWIVFLPSKTHSTASDVGVPNRYYGKFEDGTLKVRGIEVQRHSTPGWIYDVQQGMLDVFQEADEALGFMERIPRALACAYEAARALRERLVQVEDLGLTVQTTRLVDDYAANTNTRAALRRLQETGIGRHPGEYVKYVIARGRGPWGGRATPVELIQGGGCRPLLHPRKSGGRHEPGSAPSEPSGPTPDGTRRVQGHSWFGGSRPTYDVSAYLRLLARSVETMLSPFGYTEEGLLRWFTGASSKPRSENATLDVTPGTEWARA